MKKLAAATLAVAALALAPTANATPDQYTRLHNVMAEAGIDLYPKAEAAALGVCAEVWSGRHPEFVAAIVSAANPSWFFEQAEAFVAASILIYCPPEQPFEQKYIA